MSELQREFDETVKATLDATLAVTKKYARPERAAILVVGDRAKIESRLRDLKLGDVVVVDSEAKPASGAGAPGTGPSH
jgi:hypothetical protein